MGKPSGDLETNFSLAVIEDFLSDQSNGGIARAMLAAQYAAVHSKFMDLARAVNTTVDLVVRDLLLRQMSALGKLSVAQYEALTRIHRDVNVGHVSVNQGGQAIVGSVTQNQLDRPAEEAAAPPALLTDAKAVPMPVVEDRRERMPVSVSRTEGIRRRKSRGR